MNTPKILPVQSSEDKKGQIIVTPVTTPEWILEKLLAGINRRNIHHEIDPRDTLGKEEW